MTDPLYYSYWARKRLLERCPPFPVVYAAPRELNGELLELLLTAVRDKQRLLDFGAGSLHVRDALVANGFRGGYETLDIGTEFSYTYHSLAEVAGSFDAILLLDVLEHLPLQDGLELLRKLTEKLSSNGVLILQTPNARCVRSPFTSDMTHIQAYNLPDLWAYLCTLNCEAIGRRIAFRGRFALRSRLTEAAGRFVITQLLGLDYADNILLIATKLI